MSTSRRRPIGLVTPGELCEDLGISRKTLSVWRQQPGFPEDQECPVCGHGPLLDIAAVRRWRETRSRD